jgi:hypothetical protein
MFAIHPSAFVKGGCDIIQFDVLFGHLFFGKDHTLPPVSGHKYPLYIQCNRNGVFFHEKVNELQKTAAWDGGGNGCVMVLQKARSPDFLIR